MTTKLVNFKAFLSKATYQPVGIKPCNKPGQHRHWGRMDCHDIPQKHKKHLKMGVDLHHGMDSTGQIPEGIVPPNAHDFYDDGHHSAKAHGEHTGGGTAGNCYPCKSIKTAILVPFHRHPGADYCHDITQKHGGSSPNKLVAQQWHNTHHAQIQESWYLFNESQGLPQSESTADPYDAGDDHVEELIEEEAALEEGIDAFFDEVTESFADQIEPSGSVANPHNASENDIITLKEDYFVDHPAKTYKIQNTYEEDGILAANIEHTETGHEHAIALDDDNIDSIEHWQPEGEAVDSLNPHEFTIGSTLTTQQGQLYEITGIDVSGNKIFYNVWEPQSEADKAAGNPIPAPIAMTYILDGFNEWVTDMYAGDENFKVNPPNVPDGFDPLAVGDTIGTWNIGNLQVGAVIHNMSSDGFAINQGEITEVWKPEGAEETLYRVEWKAAFKDSSGNIKTSGGSWDGVHDTSEVVDSNWELVADAPEISQEDKEKFLSDDGVESIPKIGATVDSANVLSGVISGTTLVSNNGSVLYVTGNNSDSQIIDFTMDHLSEPQKITYSTLLEGIGYPYSVQSLPDVASFVKNKGFVLGGKVTTDNFMSLPIGLSFLAVNGNTVTVTNNNASDDNPPYLIATIETKDGLVYKDQVISEMSEFGDDAAETGLKIAGLPDGTVIQHVAEPTGVTPINKHGLDKGTTIKFKNYLGEVYSGKIVKTHKTKAGQNYTLEFTEGSFEGETTKITSGQINDAGTNLDDENWGVVVEEAVHKPGQEPTDGEELTLPPLGSEPGNWDEVLEATEIGQLGYNAGGQFKHKQTGDEFYIKFSSSGNDDQVKSEDLANKLYELLGVPTLGTSLIDFQGKTALKSSWDGNLETININDMANESAIMDNFVIDAWLANWDVIGPKHDNTQKSGNNIVKVDSGGALGFHGAGSPKAFPNDVKELESMRDPSVASVAPKVFGNVSGENLISGAQKLAKVTDAQIDAIVNASKISNKAKMAATLKARRDSLVQQVLSKDLKQGSDWTESLGKPGQHKHKGYQGWHSETLKHPASNKAANSAHKELGLEYHETTLGATSTEGERFWDLFNATPKDPKVTELAKKAFAHDFKVGGYKTDVQKAISDFLKENGIEDTWGDPSGSSKGVFKKWQGGSSFEPRIRVNAAIAKLKGIDKSLRAAEGSYWMHTRNADAGMFATEWEAGVNESMGLIPYIIATQQQVKTKATKANPDILPIVYRGLKGPVVDTIKKAVKQSEGKGKRVSLAGGIQGFSFSKGTSNTFAGYNGVVFSKKRMAVDDVLLYFPTWNGGYSEEEELLIDPAATESYSLNEVKFKGD